MRIITTLFAVSVFLGCNQEELANKKSQPNNGPAMKPDANPIPSKEFSHENLVWVAGGTFRMGGTTGQKDEQPVHTVKLNGFWIGKFEVTNAEFSEFTKATGYKTVAEAAPKAEDFPDIPLEQFKEMGLKPGSIVFTPPNVDIAVERLKDHGMFTQWWKYVDGANWRFPQGPNQPGTKDKPKHPVAHIAWYDAVAYCDWKTKITGVPLRRNPSKCSTPVRLIRVVKQRAARNFEPRTPTVWNFRSIISQLISISSRAIPATRSAAPGQSSAAWTRANPSSW